MSRISSGFGHPDARGGWRFRTDTAGSRIRYYGDRQPIQRVRVGMFVGGHWSAIGVARSTPPMLGRAFFQFTPKRRSQLGESAGSVGSRHR
jgi:hypothetical protein